VKIALVDYGAGNLASVRKALAAVGAEVDIPPDPGGLSGAHAVVVPGVGHFAATATLDAPWRAALLEGVRDGRPLLGICLGMQWLFDGSDEAPGVSGLGLLEGTCFRLEAPRPLKVPHVGWNLLARTRDSVLLEGLDGSAYSYFAHSYGVPVTTDTVATCTHGSAFAAAVERGRVFGVQFHPEKSGDAGLQILRNFARFAHAG
jgi:imidazole glycerol-phosphate synthase subunit HisH